MSYPRMIVLFSILAIVSCSKINHESMAYEEIRKRELSYNIAGLKSSTRKLDSDGAFLFRDAGFFNNLSDKDRKQLVVHASNTNNFGLVKVLLELNQDPLFSHNELDGHLERAVRQGFERTVRLLIDSGAKLKSGSLFRSIYNDNYGFVSFIIKKGPEFEASEFEESLYVAARIGHIEAIKAIVDSNEAPNFAIENAIFGGAIMEEFEVIKYLIKMGVDVNHRDDDGCSALHSLAQDGTIEMVKFMIESGAEINAECRGRETPLKWAYYGKNEKVIEFLKNNGAQVYEN